jgi:hypothetical protein
MASHERTPTFRFAASFAIVWKSSLAWLGAGSGPGREKGALTSALREADSFDMIASRTGVWIVE